MTLHAATTNQGKLREFAEAAASEGVEILSLPGLSALPEPIEDAPDFMGNAVLKAVAYSLAAPGLLVFADDSGLEIDRLGGRPGVRSARFANDLGFAKNQVLGKDARNNLCVLALLREAELTARTTLSRTARFRCALVLACDGEILLRGEGACAGEILPDAESPRGENGFGYDPLFLLPASGKTIAELTQEEKWSISHRGKAFRSLLLQLRGFRLQYGEDIAQAGR